MRGIRAKELAVLVLIFVAGFSLRMAFTARSRYLVNGIDGPYYVSQIDYLVETGEMLHKDSPLTFYYLWLWRILLGDTVKGIKVGMSLVTALMCVPAFFLARSVTKSSLAGYFTATVAVLNPYLFSMTYNLYKNELGILLLFAYFALFLHFVEDPARRRWLIAPLGAMLVVIWTTHIMAAGMSVLFTAAYLAFLLLADRELAKRVLRLVAAVGAVVAVVLVVSALIFPASFYKVYKLKFLTDLLEDESDAPKFAPSRQGGTAMGFLLFNLDPARWFGFPAIVAVGYLAYSLCKGRRMTLAVFVLSSYISWLLFINPLISRELVWRFTLASFFPLSIAIGYGLWVIYRRLPSLLVIPIVALVLGLSATEAVAAAARAKPTITEERYMELVRMRPHVPEHCAIAGGAGESYWFEVVLRKKLVRGHYVEEDFEGDPILLIVDKEKENPWWFHGPPRPGGHPPPLPEKIRRRATVIFDGRFYTAYLVPPRPHR